VLLVVQLELERLLSTDAASVLLERLTNAEETNTVRRRAGPNHCDILIGSSNRPWLSNQTGPPSTVA